MFFRALTPRRSRRHDSFVALTLVAFAVLALGTAAHLKHHLDDPECDGGRAPTSHPCVSCSGLHGGALAEEFQIATPYTPLESLERPALQAASPLCFARGACSPRAPPLA